MSERMWLILVSLGTVTILSAAIWGALLSQTGHDHNPDVPGKGSGAARVAAPPPQTVEPYLNHARINDVAGRHGSALEACNKALDLEPERPDIYVERAKVYWDMDRPDQALCDCETAIRLCPEHSPAFVVRGRIRFISGDHTEALSDFSHAIELTPDDPKLYRVRAEAYSDISENDLAIADLSRMIELDGALAHSYYARACQHAAVGNDDAAIADYRAALAISPDNCWYYVRLARAYTLRGDHELAIEQWTEFLTVGANEMHGLTGRAAALSRAERLVEADRDVASALAQSPTYPPALLLRAWLAVQRGQEERARDDLERVAAFPTKRYAGAARDALRLLDVGKGDEWEMPID